MEIAYDEEVDAAYIYFADRDVVSEGKVTTYACTREADGIHLDLDVSGRLLGIEVLDASQRLPKEWLS